MYVVTVREREIERERDKTLKLHQNIKKRQGHRLHQKVD